MHKCVPKHRCTLCYLTLRTRWDGCPILDAGPTALRAKTRGLIPQFPNFELFHNKKYSITLLGPSWDLNQRHHDQQSHMPIARQTKQSIYSYTSTFTTLNVLPYNCIYAYYYITIKKCPSLKYVIFSNFGGVITGTGPVPDIIFCLLWPIRTYCFSTKNVVISITRLWKIWFHQSRKLSWKLQDVAILWNCR